MSSDNISNVNKIAAIVVTYNRSSLLQECVQALQASEKPADILIVDNASTDDTQTICAAMENIRYFNTGQNLGGAGGFHYGIKKAYELGYEYFWLMDDDTLVHPDTLMQLLEADRFLQGQYGFLSSIAVWTDGTECKMNYHTVSKDWNDAKNLLQEGLLKITTATFVSFFFRRDTLQQCGLPIPEYFIWGDDTEYSLRLSAAKPSYLCYNSTVTHKMKENVSSKALVEVDDPARVDRMFYSIRNDFCTYRRIGGEQLLRFFARHTREFFKVLFRKNPYKGRKLKIMTKGFFKGLVFNPRIERVQ